MTANVTGHCQCGRHQRCYYTDHGPITLPAGYVSIGLNGPVVATVIEPTHTYTCPCDCHTSGQLNLFGTP